MRLRSGIVIFELSHPKARCLGFIFFFLSQIKSQVSLVLLFKVMFAPIQSQFIQNNLQDNRPFNKEFWEMVSDDIALR